jgi:hypothetical protein
MTEETTNLVLEHLRHISATLDVMHTEMRDFLAGPGLPEHSVASLHVLKASQNVEIDRIKERLERIERRLELTDR